MGQGIPDGRNGNGSSLKSQGGHHRCVLTGLVSDNGGTTCEWGMDRISQSNAYKLSETPCSFSGPQTLPSADKRLSDQIRQHNSGYLYKQARGSPIEESACLGKNNIVMEQKELAVSQSDTCARPNEYIGAALLSKGNPQPGEWRLHPEVVHEIWCKYGQAKADLFASEENTHCPLFFSLKGMDVPLGMDALAHPCPETLLYAFPPISLILPTLSRISAQRVSVLLIVPLWPGRTWTAEIVQLLYSHLWRLPQQRDLLSLAGERIFHPHPERWNLWVWPVKGLI